MSNVGLIVEKRRHKLVILWWDGCFLKKGLFTGILYTRIRIESAEKTWKEQLFTPFAGKNDFIPLPEK